MTRIMSSESSMDITDPYTQKSNASVITCQQKPEQIQINHEIYSGLVADPLQYFSHYTPAEKILFNRLLWMDRVWQRVSPSQLWLATKQACSREYINRLIARMVEDGLIIKIKRGWKETNIYKVNEYFRQPHIRKKLSKIFPAIVVFSLSLLGSSFQSSSSHYINKYLNKNISIAYSYIYTYIESPLKKGRFMNNALPTIKGLNLTRYGQLKLCVYPQEAIAYAETELNKARDIRSPLGFVHAKCKEWCMKHGRKIEWGNKHKHMQVGETYQENEPELQSSSTLKASSVNNQSATKDSHKQNQSGAFRSLKDISAYQQRDETIQHYNPGKGYKEDSHREIEEGYVAAEKSIADLQTELGKKKLSLFGFVNPWWKLCTEDEQARLLLKYPFIAPYINKQGPNSYLQELADRITEYNKEVRKKQA